MESYSEHVSEPQDGVQSLESTDPTSFGQSSFSDALDRAFAGLESGETSDQEDDQGYEEETEEGYEETEEGYEDEPEEGYEETEEGYEEDPTDQLSDDTDWTPKAARRFQQLKEELKGSRKELDDLRQLSKEQESRLEELSAIAESEDIAQMQTRIDEYERDRMFANLETSRAYREAVDEPIQLLVAQADQIADKYGIDAGALIDVFTLEDSESQDERISEILPHASDRDKAKIYRILEEINPILEKRQKLYEHVAEATYESEMLDEAQRKQELAERARLRANVTQNVVDRIIEKVPFVNSLEGVDFAAIKNKAASIDPSVIHPVDFAYNAISAQLFPTIVREYVGLRKELDHLTDKLAEYESAEPKISGGSGNGRSPRSGVQDGGFVDAINRAFGG